MAKTVQSHRSSALVLMAAAVAIMWTLGSTPGAAQSRAHVYLFRGLADVYSLGMNTLAGELNARGVNATAHSHTDWKSIADKVAAAYEAGREGPIILIGHSLGADAVMEMADYLGDKGVPVALVVPFDGDAIVPGARQCRTRHQLHAARLCLYAARARLPRLTQQCRSERRSDDQSHHHRQIAAPPCSGDRRSTRRHWRPRGAAPAVAKPAPVGEGAVQTSR